MSRAAYIASDDSALLRRALTPYSGQACLEMGAGNAGNLLALSARFGFTVGTDLSAPGMDDWKAKPISYVISDTGVCFRDGSFDLVAFNPPYLPPEGTPDRTVDGGEDGKVPLRFLQEALRVVKRGGKVVLLLNDQARVQDFEEECSRAKFKMRVLARERVFFEELSVFEASAV